MVAIRGCQGCIGAGRECRYFGARSGIGGIRGQWGLLGVLELLGASGGVKGVLGAGKECRYLGQIGYRWHKGALRVPRGCQGALGAGRKCRYSGARRGIGGIRGTGWFLGGVRALGGTGGIKGVGVSGVHFRWQEDWEPNHIGPQSGVPALPLVPLGGVT